MVWEDGGREPPSYPIVPATGEPARRGTRTICMTEKPSLSLPTRMWRLTSTILLLLVCLAPGVGAQSDGLWNGPRAMGLVGEARDLRQAVAVDSTFQAYEADARGYVYFFLDRPDSDERTLVRTDQIALKVYWRAPAQTKQRVVGLRDEKQLPTNIKYHLDHLTVVQDDFGDLIRLGDGDEVAAVIHPVAPGAEEIYDFRLTDSLTLSLPGPTPDIRVYEVEVRPKDPGSPGVIGSVFLERGSGAIVRMNFTFTPASYVDGNLDYIRISMDNSVWEGKYWLPYRQEVELRRELPIIDFLAGSVIRGRFEIRNYQFNPQLPEYLFFGGPVSSVPRAARENFPFETGLYDQLEEEGLETSPEIEAIRRQAMTVVGRRYVSGLKPSRLYVPFVSSVYRYNRAEGSFAGAGAAFILGPTWRLQSHGGYSFGRDKGHLSVTLARTPSNQGLGLRLRWNEPNDASGRLRGSSAAMNTLGGLLAGEDYTNPYFSSSAELRYSWAVGSTGTLRLGGVWERHRSGENVVVDAAGGAGTHRPVLPVDEGDGWALELSYSRRTGVRGFTTSATARIGAFDDRSYGSVWWESGLQRQLHASGTTVEGRLQLGLSSNEIPVQSHYLLGGRHTLPGYPYRSFIGDRMALIRVEGSQPLLAPWLSIRAFVATGKTGFRRNELPDGWPGRNTDGLKSSAGVGIGLGWDLLLLDVARGLDTDGDWELVLSVQRRFWEWL